MSHFSKLVTFALIALLVALVLPAQGRAFARAQYRIAAAQAWHQARLEMQHFSMDYLELDSVLAPVVELLVENDGEVLR